MTQQNYEQRLSALVDKANSMQGTAGQRALVKIIKDLNGNGPIGELLHSLDPIVAGEVLDLLREFFVTGRSAPFNRLHEEAIDKLL